MVVKVTKLTKGIPYYRVSTRKQEESGLGLKAQVDSVAAFAAANGFELVMPGYKEAESGKRADRPQLLAAIRHAKAIRGTLIVAKLDRLSRDVMFMSTLMKSGVKFVAVDNPYATNLTIHILAAVAE